MAATLPSPVTVEQEYLAEMLAVLQRIELMLSAQPDALQLAEVTEEVEPETSEPTQLIEPAPVPQAPPVKRSDFSQIAGMRRKRR